MRRAAVGIVVASGSPPGGEERRARDLRDHLRSEGVPVVFFSPDPSEGPDDVRIPIGRLGPIAVARSAVAISREIRRRRVRVLLAYKRRSLPAAWLARRITGVRMIFNVANTWDRHDWWSRLADDRLVFISHTLRDAWVSDRPVEASRTCVIQLGTDDFRLPEHDASLRAGLGIAAEARVWISVARLAEQKRPDRLIATFAEFHQRHPRDHLIIVGDGDLLESTRALVSARGLDGTVHLVGRQSDVRPWLSIADAFVQASDREGMPNALLEAMSAGLPIVATDAGGTREVVEQGRSGWVVQRTVADLTEGLATAAEHDLAAMGRNARMRWARSFQRSGMLEAYGNLIRSLAEDDGPSRHE